MSVFTQVSRVQLEAFLSTYSVGTLVAFEGIRTGVSNTNYFVDTSAGSFVLTVFEIVPHEELPFCLQLAAHLSEHGVPSPHPVADNAGNYLGELCGKPAALWQKLSGTSVKHPQVKHCAIVGGVLARLHKAGQSFALHRDNPCGLPWARRTVRALRGHVCAEDENLMRAELDMQAQLANAELPSGVIHADLFMDNVLFENRRLGGIIDFYYACNAPLALDLAITVNDWCYKKDGAPLAELCRALLSAYLAERALQAVERECWNKLSRQAALRFWLSREYDATFPRDGDMISVKDPCAYKNILLHHVHAQNKTFPLD